MESRILRALSKLDELFWTHKFGWISSVAVPETSRNNDWENREPFGDHSLGDPCPKTVFSTYSSSNVNDSGQEETHQKVTRVQEEIRYRPHMATGVQEETPYCSPGNFFRKTKEGALYKSAEFRSENTPSTTMPTFDGKSEEFELLEDLFRTSLKINNHLTEENKRNYFHSLKHSDALQTSKNITSLKREKLGEFLTVFRRKYVKPQSIAAEKHKFQRLIFNPAKQKVMDFVHD